MVPIENKNNAYAKFGGTNKEYYGIFRSGLLLGKYLAREFNQGHCLGHNFFSSYGFAVLKKGKSITNTLMAHTIHKSLKLTYMFLRYEGWS